MQGHVPRKRPFWKEFWRKAAARLCALEALEHSVGDVFGRFSFFWKIDAPENVENSPKCR